MIYPVGTRVKKVRGQDPGYTGMVMPSTGTCVRGHTLEQWRQAWPDFDAFVCYDTSPRAVNGEVLPAGVHPAVLGNWEPIVPEGAAPSEYSYEELLESLKEEQHESV